MATTPQTVQAHLRETAFAGFPTQIAVVAAASIIGLFFWWYLGERFIFWFSVYNTAVLLSISYFSARGTSSQVTVYTVFAVLHLYLGAFVVSWTQPEPSYLLFYPMITIGLVYNASSHRQVFGVTAVALGFTALTVYKHGVDSYSFALLFTLVLFWFVCPIIWLARWRSAIVEVRAAEAQRKASLKTITGGIAHTFNNLMQIVQGYAEEPADEDNRQRLRAAADRGAEIGKAMAIYAGSLASTQRAMSGAALLEVLGVRLRHYKRLTMADLPAAAEQIEVLADIDQLSIALTCVVENAMEATGESGRVALTARVLDVLELQVTDDGPGMSVEQASLAFDPFYTTKDLGRGLGLSLAYGLISAHNGSIHLDRADPGTVVTIRLPLQRRGA